MGFKISYIITRAAQAIAGGLGSFLPQSWASMQSLTLLAALVMTGLVCVLMGCGMPTTANYIIMVTVAAPTLVQLGVQPLVAHFFVFSTACWPISRRPSRWPPSRRRHGVSDPFKTGNTAFRLGLGKVLVPFVFVFSPSLLLVANGFTWSEFVVTFTGCVLGIAILSAGLSKWLLVEMTRREQGLCVAAALLLVAPGIASGAVGLAMVLPMIWRQLRSWRAGRPIAA